MIQLPSDVPRFSTSASIDGREYVLDLDYVGKEDRWSLTVTASDGSKIIKGRKLVPGVMLNVRAFRDLRPIGVLLVTDPIESIDPVKLRDLGRRFRLVFYSLAELTT